MSATEPGAQAPHIQGQQKPMRRRDGFLPRQGLERVFPSVVEWGDGRGREGRLTKRLRLEKRELTHVCAVLLHLRPCKIGRAAGRATLPFAMSEEPANLRGVSPHRYGNPPAQFRMVSGSESAIRHREQPKQSDVPGREDEARILTKERMKGEPNRTQDQREIESKFNEYRTQAGFSDFS